MTVDEALESAAVASLSGHFALERWSQRPTCSPHHTASAVRWWAAAPSGRPGSTSTTSPTWKRCRRSRDRALNDTQGSVDWLPSIESGSPDVAEDLAEGPADGPRADTDATREPRRVADVNGPEEPFHALSLPQ